MSTSRNINLTSENIFSLIYHDIFEYPLTTLELLKWYPGRKFSGKKTKNPVLWGFDNGFFYLKGKKGLSLQRLLRKRESLRKLKIARKAARVFKKIPSVKVVAVTGSLSMLNAVSESDVDLMIVTTKGSLWTTRAVSLILLKIFGFRLRRYADKNEKDKICINMWLDESSLVWPIKDRNFYTAHEIVQIMPLVDKDKTFQMFLVKNSWVKDYWPNATKIISLKRNKSKKDFFQGFLGNLVEKMFFYIQKAYMKEKITREVVRKNRAIFHPIDRSKEIFIKLNNYC